MTHRTSGGGVPGGFAVSALVLSIAGGVTYIARARNAVEIGQFTIYGPNWDGEDAAGIPVTFDRWRIGPLFVTRQKWLAQ